MRHLRARIVLAFLAIYLLWGSTYLAIRVSVQTVPPLFAAGLRFTVAGAILYIWARSRGAPAPTPRERRSLAVLGALMFLLTYSGLFWAARDIPSGVAAVLVATVPLWTALLEMFAFKREPPRWSTLGAVLLGLGGVALLALDTAGGRISALACLVVAASQAAWSLGTSLIPTLPLPRSDLLSAGGQMLAGGAMLMVVSAGAGEIPPLPVLGPAAAAALTYQLVAGSLVAFTAYQWLLTRVSATKVTSYAYVNPVVALVIGHTLGEEPIDARTIAGCVLILASTVTLLRRRRPSPG